MAEPFLTTVVGSMSKPPWLYSQVSFDSGVTDHHGHGGDWALQGQELAEAQDDATRLVIRYQERARIEITSDGEQRRKSYITTRLEGKKPCWRGGERFTVEGEQIVL